MPEDVLFASDYMYGLLFRACNFQCKIMLSIVLFILVYSFHIQKKHLHAILSSFSCAFSDFDS